ncbi:beta-galactosidase [Zunongwangia mangrovi]|uniref:Beta-galactosidase n=1 Tax=Zunongwangia mangrovi TaxID=1334022 RepID=A0A1I1N2N2_9FLAO|nr:glycoside hydrolase family 2 TIM barrel-domain containing protein [Zunongwangia mangrovi]SFC91924.1 beta-galactosidase [Zunongwangia mangrovi]
MSKLFSLFLLCLLFFSCQSDKNFIKNKHLFDDGWKFFLGDTSNAVSTNFNDENWRSVSLPHDWSIESAPDISEPSKGDGGYYPNGVGWYRKTFSAPEDWSDKKLNIYFEGVYMNAEVYLNEKKLGIQPYGYTSFSFDLTPYLQIGKKNTIAVRVNNSEQKNSRWYSGSGIYRHVWLNVTNDVHISQWGLKIATPSVSKESATVNVISLIKNESNESRKINIKYQVQFEGDAIAESENSEIIIQPNEEYEVEQKFEINNPLLWHPDSPELYNLEVRLFENSNLIDNKEETFGIRDLKFSAVDGFELNGKKTVLYGGNVHHDNGSLGAAAYDRAEIRKVKLLKEAGFNAVRTSHNPPSETFLYACDSLGLLVIDEAFDGWKVQKNTHDYAKYFEKWWKHDVQSMVLRDQNHPSIIMWSIGNEIIERKSPEAVETARKLSDAVKEIDTTRPVTSAMTTWDNDWEIFDPLMAEHDVAGYNYQLFRAEEDHSRKPSRIILQTESYPNKAFFNWNLVRKHDYIVGDFVWTAMDYLGESGIGQYYYPGEPAGEHWAGDHFPWHGAYCGDINLIGQRKPISHYRSMLFNGEEKLYMAVQEPNPEEGNIQLTSWAVWPTWESWTWPEHIGENLKVEVYSKYPNLKLFLNDSLVGEDSNSIENEFKTIFEVPYESGVLRVIGYDDDSNKESFELKTAAKPARIALSADRTKLDANGRDLSFVDVVITDKQGVLNPNANNLLHFELEGPGEIIAVDNASLKFTGKYSSKSRKAWKGRAMVIVKSNKEPGTIKLKVNSNKLESNFIEIETGI